jgi:RNA polymerase sigma factor (TIGR02999 family)
MTNSERKSAPCDASPVSRILHDWGAGDNDAVERLVPLVYSELRQLAASQMRSERSNHTLQPTALVHEAYARLVNVDVPWSNRRHFFAVAARMMRRILVDHARSRGSAKRGGDLVRVELDQPGADLASPESGIEELDEALEALSARDERKARALELHYFAGLSHQQIAEVLEISLATVDRDLRMGRAWLRRALTDG